MRILKSNEQKPEIKKLKNNKLKKNLQNKRIMLFIQNMVLVKLQNLKK